MGQNAGVITAYEKEKPMVYSAEIVASNDAEVTKLGVEQLLTEIRSSEESLRKNFAGLGMLLLRVRTQKYYQEWGFTSFGSYIKSLEEKVGKGRTQLYHVVGVADKLLPFVTPNELAVMGISKAVLLKQAFEKTGIKPTEETIQQATDPKVDAAELKALLFKSENGSPENGQYFDLGGFYTTKDEKEEILRAFDVAAKTDPVVSNEIPEWARRKEIIQRLCMNYLSEYEALVEKGQA